MRMPWGLFLVTRDSAFCEQNAESVDTQFCASVSDEKQALGQKKRKSQPFLVSLALYSPVPNVRSCKKKKKIQSKHNAPKSEKSEKRLTKKFQFSRIFFK